MTETLDKKSSYIKSAEWDETTGKLKLTFSNNQQFEYENVPRKTWDGMTSADSVGKYFHQQIRGNFPHREI